MMKNFQRILKIPDKTADEFLKILKENYGDDVVQKINLINNTDKFQCKSMVIHDEDDIDLPWKNSEKLAEQLPDSTFVKTKGLGHVKVLYDKSVVDTVKDFFKK